MATVVNSWNEWDPLKHVIVGRADFSAVDPLLAHEEHRTKKKETLFQTGIPPGTL